MSLFLPDSLLDSTLEMKILIQGVFTFKSVAKNPHFRQKVTIFFFKIHLNRYEYCIVAVRNSLL